MRTQAIRLAVAALAGLASTVPARASSLLVVDGHNDLFIQYMDCSTCPRGLEAYDLRNRTSGDTDIPRLRAGGVGAVLLNVFGSDRSTMGTLSAFDFLRQLQARYAETFEIASTAADVRRIHAGGRIALIPTMEGAIRLENSPVMVRTLHRLGLRAVTLAYQTNDLADAADDTPRHGGLSALGRSIVQEMNRTGVMVDLSHVSAAAMHDVLDVSTAPIIFSHSSARALTDVERNVPDDVLRRLPKNGGIVMVSFVPYFTSPAHAAWKSSMNRLSDEITASVQAGTLTEAIADQRWERWLQDNPAPVVSVAEVADHIEHVRRVAGVDHVGLGSDFDGMPYKVGGLEDVAGFPRVLEELRRRGWTRQDVEKVAGANFLRVMSAVEDVARTSNH